MKKKQQEEKKSKWISFLLYVIGIALIVTIVCVITLKYKNNQDMEHLKNVIINEFSKNKEIKTMDIPEKIGIILLGKKCVNQIKKIQEKNPDITIESYVSNEKDKKDSNVMILQDNKKKFTSILSQTSFSKFILISSSDIEFVGNVKDIFDSKELKEFGIYTWKNPVNHIQQYKTISHPYSFINRFSIPNFWKKKDNIIMPGIICMDRKHEKTNEILEFIKLIEIYDTKKRIPEHFLYASETLDIPIYIHSKLPGIMGWIRENNTDQLNSTQKRPITHSLKKITKKEKESDPDFFGTSFVYLNDNNEILFIKTYQKYKNIENWKQYTHIQYPENEDDVLIYDMIGKRIMYQNGSIVSIDQSSSENVD